MADETEKNTNDGWEICLNNIKAKERQAFADDQKITRETGNDEVMIKWFARVVVRWPYKGGSPKDQQAYGELGLEDFAEVVHRVNQAFRSLYKRAIE
jgi:hypothetical protein